MRNKNNPLYRLINKVNPAIIFVLMLVLSVIMNGSIIYGISNSSLVNEERGLNEIVKESGNNIHVRYSIGNQSEASKLSLISPINEYNAYREKELGRDVSFVSSKEFTVKYDTFEFKCDYIVFEDYYNEGMTKNKFRIANGNYKNLTNDSYIYISSGFLANITGLKASKAVGQKISLSLDNDNEFTIGGVVHDGYASESGAHFKKLFGDSYILMNREAVYKYGFTDLLFGSNDDYFINDSLDFIKAYNKSYLKYDETYMRVSSYKDEEWTISNTYSPAYKFKSDDKAIRYSVLSIITLTVSTLLYLGIIIFYDFNKIKLYYKIPGAVVLFAYLFLVTFYLSKKLKAGLFMPRLSVILFTGFLILSIAAFIYAFAFFGSKKKEGTNNG